MRFVAAIISFVLAIGLIAFGFAQRTIFAEADSLTVSKVLTTDATVTVIDSKTLRSLPGRQEILLSGSDKIFAASGRSADVVAWVGNAGYNRIGYDKTTSKLTSTFVKGKTVRVPDPKGSDLWLDESSTSKSRLDLTVNVPEGISFLVVSDGAKPAPSTVAIRWALDNRTPWSGPLIIGGIVLFIVGIALFLWALIHVRRSRGPRRKTPKMPRVPRQRSYRPRKSRVTPAPVSRRAGRRRFIAVVPALVIASLAFGGATGATAATTPNPTPSGTAAVNDNLQAPAVTVAQLKLIMARVSAVATKADADKDVDLLKTRFAGAALDLRTANYAIRKVDDTVAALAAIPAGDVLLTLPQQSDSWPRTVFTVVQDPKDKTVAPVGIMLEQLTPRTQFKVEYATALQPDTTLPDVAPATLGAPRLGPDQKLLELEPSKLALDYGDILEKGPASASIDLFDTKKDSLIGLVGVDARKALVAALPATAKMAVANSDGPYDPIALGSNNAGAVVAVYLNETFTVTPVEAGAAVNPEGQVKSLSGVTGSTKGTVAVYGDQLLFYVPSATSKQKISLLGFATGLVSAKELP